MFLPAQKPQASLITAAMLLSSPSSHRAQVYCSQVCDSSTAPLEQGGGSTMCQPGVSSRAASTVHPAGVSCGCECMHRYMFDLCLCMQQFPCDGTHCCCYTNNYMISFVSVRMSRRILSNSKAFIQYHRPRSGCEVHQELKFPSVMEFLQQGGCWG